MTYERMKLVEEALDTIENKDIREFAIVLLDNMPEYVWSVPASSTKKYHPKYALGDGGLMRHQIAVVRFLNFFFELEQYNSKLTSREMDLMRVAGLVHDGMKSGSQEDFLKSKYTKFDHPLQMAEVVRSYDGKHLTSEEIEMIASLISKHMGQWNTDRKSKVVLPKPNDKCSRLLHSCDYLASRKNIAMEFDGMDTAEEKKEEVTVTLETYKVGMPRHKGKTLLQIKEEDPTYIDWMYTKTDWREPVRTLLQQLKERDN